MAAVRAGKVEALNFLLAHGADAWKADARGNLAVHHAAALTDAACLSALIAHADKLEAPDLMASDRYSSRLLGRMLTESARLA